MLVLCNAAAVRFFTHLKEHEIGIVCLHLSLDAGPPAGPGQVLRWAVALCTAGKMFGAQGLTCAYVPSGGRVCAGCLDLCVFVSVCVCVSACMHIYLCVHACVCESARAWARLCSSTKAHAILYLQFNKQASNCIRVIAGKKLTTSTCQQGYCT